MTRVKNRYPRIPCVVPFCSCGLTCYPPGNEVICSKHYRLVDAWLKARRRKWRRLAKKAGRDQSAKANRIERHLWAMMVRQAITRAAGAPL